MAREDVERGRSVYARCWLFARQRLPADAGREGLLRLLGRARLVCVSPEQERAVQVPADGQVTYGHVASELAGTRAPFPTVFLAVGAESEVGAEVVTIEPLYAALITEDHRPNRLPRVIPFWTDEHRRPFCVGFASGHAAQGFEIRTWSPDLPEKWPEIMSSVADGAERALRVLRMLESANVYLDDAGPAPAGHRSARQPAYDVVVRLAGGRRRRPRAGGERPDWTHRWEVRGHYKHFGPGTRMFERAEPAKRLSSPARGEHVRIWCPPYVKGPEDKPLVPKRRVIVPSRSASGVAARTGG